MGGTKVLVFKVGEWKMGSGLRCFGGGGGERERKERSISIFRKDGWLLRLQSFMLETFALEVCGSCLFLCWWCVGVLFLFIYLIFFREIFAFGHD